MWLLTPRIVLPLLLCVGCTPSDPFPPAVGVPLGDGGVHFADSVISERMGNMLVTCTATATPVCNQANTGPCYPNAAIGANDGAYYVLQSGDVIELAFYCSEILENGIKIWTAPAEDDGGSFTGAVAVSQDGSNYEDVPPIFDTPDETFSLAPLDAPVARFVRITNTGSTPISVDAVEAL